MKRLWIGIIVAFIATAAFYFLNLTGIVPIIITAIIVFGLTLVSSIVLDKIEEKKVQEEEEAKEKAIEMKTIQEYALELSNEFQHFSKYTSQFCKIVCDFINMKDGIEEIIKLTGENAFINQASQDVEEDLKKVANRLRIKFNVLEGLPQYDYRRENVVPDEIEKILEETRKYVSDYADILIEAGKKEDDEANVNLQEKINKLKEAREKVNSFDDEDPLEGLYVTTSGGNDFGI